MSTLPGRPFQPGDPRTREAGRKGGLAKPSARRRTIAPYSGTILEAMDEAGLTGPTWAAWRTFWRAVFGLGLPGDHLTRYQAHTKRTAAPSAPVGEAWAICGRGAGKSRGAALGAAYKGITFDVSRLAPGELALIPVIASNKDQARVVLHYLKALFALPTFRPFVHRVLKASIELHTGLNIEVLAASFRTLRGYTLPCVVADEVAFWARESDSLNADTEIMDAVRPGLGRVDGSLLLGISSPYARKGELWEVYDHCFGVEDAHVLVWVSDTLGMNPTYQRWRIERAYQDDPVVAASEYGAEGRVTFRSDVEAFVDAGAIQAVTVHDRRELAPVPGTPYVGFVDPSGGSQDSFTVAVAHREGSDRAVLDAVRERRPPFSPDAVVEEFASLLRSYGLSEVTGDRYGGEWPREAFRAHGVTYKPSEKAKSDLYRELLPAVNAGRVELLDLPALRAQFAGLERRVARGGKDSIDHAPGGHDDVANAAAGALVGALPAPPTGKRMIVWSLGAGHFGGGEEPLTPKPAGQVGPNTERVYYPESYDREGPQWGTRPAPST